MVTVGGEAVSFGFVYDVIVSFDGVYSFAFGNMLLCLCKAIMINLLS